MRILSLLITLCFTVSVSAYDVVLKSGKRIQGIRIGEDNLTIQMKDQRDGTLLSIKKSVVDLVATDQANQNQQRSVQADPVQEQEGRVPKTIVEIAEETRKARTGKAPLLTNGDVPQDGSVSVFGSSDSTRFATMPANESNIPGKDERYWRKEAATFRRELSTIREKLISADARCLKARERASTRLAGSHKKAENLLVLMETPVECAQRDETEQQLHDSEARLYDFEERARRAQVPWQWIE